MHELNVERINSGDITETKRLFEMLLPRVRLMAIKAGIPGADTDDAAQLAILRVFASIHKFDPSRGASLLRWCQKVAKNVILDSLRTAQGPEPTPDSEAAEAYPDPIDMDLDLTMIVNEALAVLPFDSREILLLKYVEGWTTKEIAKKLGLHQQLVSKKLDDAENKFRLLLRGEPKQGSRRR